jgi:hypothetical protein
MPKFGDQCRKGGDIFSRKTVRFNERIVLDPALLAAGSATFDITVVAADIDGAQASKQLKVDIRPLELSDRSSKMSILVEEIDALPDMNDSGVFFVVSWWHGWTHG